MASKIFLDANILLDLTLKRDSHKEADQILEMVINGRVQAFITPSIIHITGYWLTKAYGTTIAKELLLTLLIDVTVIDIPHNIALTALHSKITDIEDALQYYSAIHHKIDYFISRDKQLQKNSIPTLPVYTPKEFIREFSI
ncbi:MAG TPA: PIN domain-containing protein [Mucilaginibacter sp.]|jgi:predicted nucleic acid-binding protein|nr:PIN domain-containing protein [Mucilaginibacter sp.]